MPVALTLRLRPSRPWRPDTKQVHGLASALFLKGSADHDAQEKRFAIWPVAADPDDPYVGLVLRCAWLRDALPPSDIERTGRLRLGSVPCDLVSVDRQTASYAELAASRPQDQATLTFWSPTYFSRNGGDVVLPDPRLIVGSHRRRWNHAQDPGSVLLIDDDLWQRLHRALRLSAFDLKTMEMDSGRGHPQTGFVGTVTLRVEPGTPTDVRVTFRTLVRFASYAGTGAQTTHGFGATTSDLDGAGRG